MNAPTRQEEVLDKLTKRLANTDGTVYVQMFLKRLAYYKAGIDIVEKGDGVWIEIESDMCALCRKRNTKDTHMDDNAQKIRLRIFCTKCGQRFFAPIQNPETWPSNIEVDR